jgi:hypothetical protein
MENMRGVKLTENAARGIEVTSLASIAISLKRIADSLQYKPTAGGEIKMPDMFIDFSKKVGI